MVKVKKLFMEAVIVGLMVVLGGTLVGAIVGPFLRVPLPAKCKKWNTYYVMEITLFLTGVLVHLFCEFIGLNRWYCKYGAAC